MFYRTCPAGKHRRANISVSATLWPLGLVVTRWSWSMKLHYTGPVSIRMGDHLGAEPATQDPGLFSLAIPHG